MIWTGIRDGVAHVLPGNPSRTRLSTPCPALTCEYVLSRNAADCRAITASQIADVLRGWRHPEHENFRPRNAWSLFNALTGGYRGINPPPHRPAQKRSPAWFVRRGRGETSRGPLRPLRDRTPFPCDHRGDLKRPKRWNNDPRGVRRPVGERRHSLVGLPFLRLVIAIATPPTRRSAQTPGSGITRAIWLASIQL